MESNYTQIGDQSPQKNSQMSGYTDQSYDRRSSVNDPDDWFHNKNQKFTTADILKKEDMQDRMALGLREKDPKPEKYWLKIKKHVLNPEQPNSDIKESIKMKINRFVIENQPGNKVRQYEIMKNRNMDQARDKLENFTPCIVTAPGQPKIESGLKQKEQVQKEENIESRYLGDVQQMTIEGLDGIFLSRKASSIQSDEKLCKKTLYNVFSEFFIGQDFDCPNLVKYMYFIYTFDKKSDYAHYQILQEYPEGNLLSSHIKSQGQLFYVIDYVENIALQISTGLKYLHDRCVINQNVNPNNLIFSLNGDNIKFIDSGLKQMLRKEDDKVAKVSTPVTPMSVLQTPTKNNARDNIRYMSPEQILGKDVSFKSDIWAFACVLLHLCTGLSPYDLIKDIDKIGQTILFNKTSPLDYALVHHEAECLIFIENPSLMSLLMKCFQYDIKFRPSSSEVLDEIKLGLKAKKI